MRKWESEWGLAIGLSLPGTKTAWFVVDDFELGRFASVGVRIIDNVAFGDSIAIYSNDLDHAAQFALCYGVRRGTMLFIENVLAQDLEFPAKHRKLNRLWGPTNELEYLSLIEGLQYLQSVHGIDPLTAQAASKTVEVANE